LIIESLFTIVFGNNFDYSGIYSTTASSTTSSIIAFLAISCSIYFYFSTWSLSDYLRISAILFTFTIGAIGLMLNLVFYFLSGAIGSSITGGSVTWILSSSSSRTFFYSTWGGGFSMTGSATIGLSIIYILTALV